jgi:hypothetical protein
VAESSNHCNKAVRCIQSWNLCTGLGNDPFLRRRWYMELISVRTEQSLSCWYNLLLLRNRDVHYPVHQIIIRPWAIARSIESKFSHLIHEDPKQHHCPIYFRILSVACSHHPVHAPFSADLVLLNLFRCDNTCGTRQLNCSVPCCRRLISQHSVPCVGASWSTDPPPASLPPLKTKSRARYSS